MKCDYIDKLARVLSTDGLVFESLYGYMVIDGTEPIDKITQTY